MDLSIYAVRRDGEDFEAQAFTKCPLPSKVHLSRKRRIQRLRRSANFVEDFESDEGRIIVLSIPADGIERHWKGQPVAANKETHQDLSVKNYPPLCLPQGNKSKSQVAEVWSGNPSMSFAAATSAFRQPSNTRDTFERLNDTLPQHSHRSGGPEWPPDPTRRAIKRSA